MRAKRTRAVVGVMLMHCLCACAGVPAKAPEVTLPAAFEPAANPDEPSVTAPVDLANWWLSFRDPEMTELVNQALSNSPTSDKARAVLDEARSTRRGANNILLPNGDPSLISQSSGPSLRSLGPQTRSATLSVQWEADVFGTNRASIGVAQAAYDQARFTYEVTRAALAADVASSVIQIRGFQAQLLDASEAVRISEELLRITRLKAERGLVGQADVASFEGDLATARAQVLFLTESIRAAQRTLLILLGRGSESTTVLAIGVTDFAVPEMPTGLPSDLVARRPDVRRDASALAVAIGNHKVAKLGYFPTLLLEPIFSNTEVGAASTSTSTLEGIITQPLFSLPRIMTQVRVTNARQRQALINYEQSVATAFGEAENALAAYRTDLKRLDELATAQLGAKTALDAEQLKYQAGYSDQATLLQREQAWRQAAISHTNLRVSTLQDAVTAFKALGGGWTPPTPDKN